MFPYPPQSPSQVALSQLYVGETEREETKKKNFNCRPVSFETEEGEETKKKLKKWPIWYELHVIQKEELSGGKGERLETCSHAGPGTDDERWREETIGRRECVTSCPVSLGNGVDSHTHNAYHHATDVEWGESALFYGSCAYCQDKDLLIRNGRQ